MGISLLLDKSMTTPNDSLSILIAQRQSIAEKLLKCSVFDDPRTFINYLNPEIHQKIKLPNPSTSREIVLALLQTCEQFPTGYSHLLEVLEFHEKGSVAFHNFMLFLVSLRIKLESVKQYHYAVYYNRPLVGIFPEERLFTLRQLLLSNVEVVKKHFAAFQKEVDKFGVRSAAKPDAMSLWGQPAVNVYPFYPLADHKDPTVLLRFVERLTADVALKPADREQLRDWIAQTAQQLDIDFSPAAKSTVSNQEANKERLHLVVELTATGFAKKQPTGFKVKAYYFLGEQTSRTLDVSTIEYTRLTLEKELIPELKRQIYLQMKDHSQISSMVIEFILPRNLLDYPVENLLAAPTLRLGVKHPVVVRSRERMVEQEYVASQSYWYDNWQKLLSSSECCDRQMLWLKKTDQTHFEQVVSSKPALGVGFKVAPEPRPKKPDGLVSLCGYGVPVALWLRDKYTEFDLEQQLKPLLKHKSWLELPDLIKDLRAESHENGYGTHLVLLWDNPQHIATEPSHSPPVTLNG
jgi:hypothetical protein